MKRITLPALGLVVFLVTRPTPSLALVGPNVGDACTLAGSTTPASPNAGGENLVCTSGLWTAVAAGAAGSTGYVQFNTGGALTGDADLFWDNTNKYLGIDTATPAAPLDIESTITGTTGKQFGIENYGIIQPSADETITGSWAQPVTYGVYNYATIPVANAKAVNVLDASENDTENYGSGNVGYLFGSESWAYNAGTSAISHNISGTGIYSELDGGSSTWLEGADIWSGAYGGTVTNMAGVGIWLDGGATITNRYGVFIGIPSGTATNDYGFYEAGTQQNYFAGDVNTATEYLIGGNIVLNVNNTSSLVVGQSGATSETGVDNTIVGYNAGNVNTTGVGNAAFGARALASNTTGSYNTAIGQNALVYATTGSRNTAVGINAMLGSSGNGLTGQYNTGIGGSALNDIQTTATSNTAVGYQVGNDITTGANNSILGVNAMFYDTTGSNNTALGAQAMQGVSGSELTGSDNTAVGDSALISVETTAADNTAIGYAAGYSQTTANYNTLNGSSAGYYITTGSYNTAIGNTAMFGVSGSGLTGQYNTALGYYALYTAQTTAAGNTALGSEALADNTTGSYNTAVGFQAGHQSLTTTNNVLMGYDAGYYITTGSHNTALGNTAMGGVSGSELTGAYNTAVGDSALYSITTTGNSNTAVGYQAGYSQTTAGGNTLNGYQAGYYITTGISNTAVGVQAMQGVSGSGLTGADNVAVGNAALYSLQTTANENTATGFAAGYSQTTATNNVLNGYQAGDYITTGSYNTALGNAAMKGVFGSELTGSYNVAVGASALSGVTTTAVGNTAVGLNAGYSGTSITTGTYDTFVGYAAQSNGATYTNGTAIGNGAVLTASNEVVLGNSSVTQTLLNGDVGIGTASPTMPLTVMSSSPGLVDLYGDSVHVRHFDYGGTQEMYETLDTTNNVYRWTAQNSYNFAFLNGNVGIGTTSPGAVEDVYTASAPALRLEEANGGPWALQILDDAFSTNWANSAEMFQNPGGALVVLTGGSGGVALTVGATAWVSASDIRMKKNIETLPVLDRLDGYRAVSFDWKATGKRDIGVIAQELYKVFPEAVTKGSDDPNAKIKFGDPNAWGVEYSKLGALALEGVKELKADNDNLHATNKSEAAQIKTQEAQIEATNDNLLHRISAVKADNDNLRELIAAQSRLVSTQGHEIEELRAQIAKVAH